MSTTLGVLAVIGAITAGTVVVCVASFLFGSWVASRWSR